MLKMFRIGVLSPNDLLTVSRPKEFFEFIEELDHRQRFIGLPMGDHLGHSHTHGLTSCNLLFDQIIVGPPVGLDQDVIDLLDSDAMLKSVRSFD